MESPDNFHEVWHGGHFRCDNAQCGYQADLDYVGAVNVALVFFGDSLLLDTVSRPQISEILKSRQQAVPLSCVSRSAMCL